MKTIVASVMSLGLLLTISEQASSQQNQPFCLRDADGKLDCHFETMKQCQEALKGRPIKGGACVPNPKTQR
jgi:hypothetical protein